MSGTFQGFPSRCLKNSRTWCRFCRMTREALSMSLLCLKERQSTPTLAASTASSQPQSHPPCAACHQRGYPTMRHSCCHPTRRCGTHHHGRTLERTKFAWTVHLVADPAWTIIESGVPFMRTSWSTDGIGGSSVIFQGICRSF